MMGAPSREDVETLCAAALDLPPGERQAFLARSCGHDPVFAQRVRSLLADYERLGSTLDHAVWSGGRHGGPTRHQTVTTGTSVGPYEIVSVIGAGGMGEVYKARDRRLGRAVAIEDPAALVCQGPGSTTAIRAGGAGGVGAGSSEHLHGLRHRDDQRSRARVVARPLHRDGVRGRCPPARGHTGRWTGRRDGH